MGRLHSPDFNRVQSEAVKNEMGCKNKMQKLRENTGMNRKECEANE